jgi:hypothetical protein
MLDRSGVLEALGAEHIFPTVEAAVEAFRTTPDRTAGAGVAASGADATQARQASDSPAT